MPAKSTELAWLAGFIDADGHIGVEYSRLCDTYALRVGVCNTHKPSVEKCQSLMGGGLYPNGFESSTRKQSWRGSLAGAATKDLLKRVFPYMVTKKRQAAIAFVFPMGSGGNGRPAHPLLKILQKECYKALGALNKRGPADA